MQTIIRQALHCVDIFVEGRHPLDQAVSLIEDLDPLLIYFMMRFMRENKKVCGDGTRSRLVQFIRDYPHLTNRLKNVPKDSMIEWFDDNFSIQNFASSSEFIHLIVEKMES